MPSCLSICHVQTPNPAECQSGFALVRGDCQPKCQPPLVRRAYDLQCGEWRAISRARSEPSPRAIGSRRYLAGAGAWAGRRATRLPAAMRRCLCQSLGAILACVGPQTRARVEHPQRTPTSHLDPCACAQRARPGMLPGTWGGQQCGTPPATAEACCTSTLSCGPTPGQLTHPSCPSAQPPLPRTTTTTTNHRHLPATACPSPLETLVPNPDAAEWSAPSKICAPICQF